LRQAIHFLSKEEIKFTIRNEAWISRTGAHSIGNGVQNDVGGLKRPIDKLRQRQALTKQSDLRVVQGILMQMKKQNGVPADKYPDGQDRREDQTVEAMRR